MTKKNIVVVPEAVAIAVAQPHGSTALFPYPQQHANIGGSAGSFGILLYLIPVPAFYGVYNEGRIEGLITSIPYSISIFICMLRIYFALLSGYVSLLINNIFGFLSSTICITIYLIDAPKKAKIYTSMLIILLDVALFSLILLITLLLWEGEERIVVLDWIYLSCLIITSFVSPLSTIYQVIQTRSIKCMPFYDPLLTTLGASAWLVYAILINDIHIAVPNALSLMFGVIQMVIYMKYKDISDLTPPTEEPTGPDQISIEMVQE